MILFNAWEAVLDDIEDNSPYHAKFVDNNVELLMHVDDNLPHDIVGTLYTPADWEYIKRDAHRLGIWPTQVSF